MNLADVIIIGFPIFCTSLCQFCIFKISKEIFLDYIFITIFRFMKKTFIVTFGKSGGVNIDP
jgi:hypothetical protein